MRNFSEIIKDSKLYNFHSHTQYCDGNSAMEDFVIEAITEGFTDYGFSPHCPIQFGSPCNMKFEDVQTYLTEVDRLKAKYSGKINLYASMEIDYIDESWGPSNDYFHKIPLDYRLGSVHFIPYGDSFVDIDGRYENFKKKMSNYFNNDIEYVVKSFYQQSIKMVEAGGFDIIGHFDKVGHNASHFREGIEEESWYEKLVMDLFDSIISNNILIEINTKAWGEHNRFFPNQKYFNWLVKYKAPIIINSDAHYPHLINAGREDAYKYLKAECNL